MPLTSATPLRRRLPAPPGQRLWYSLGHRSHSQEGQSKDGGAKPAYPEPNLTHTPTSCLWSGPAEEGRAIWPYLLVAGGRVLDPGEAKTPVQVVAQQLLMRDTWATG